MLLSPNDDISREFWDAGSIYRNASRGKYGAKQLSVDLGWLGVD